MNQVQNLKSIRKQYFKDRESRINELYNNGLTLKEVGRQIGLTAERVRQIVNPLVKCYCSIHKRGYKDRCEYCVVEQSYLGYLRSLNSEQLSIEVKELQKYDRHGTVVIKRMILTNYLRERGKTFSQIGKLLQRHPLIVRRLYLKYLKTNPEIKI